ncbi:MAG: DUF1080 domain-containing protein, partial [Acidobacteria bacterium]|nr:DUF1080 domain-containing protein [Acidobacteriota bacterium]
MLRFFFLTIAYAQPPGANYDEAKVPRYTLPDPLANTRTAGDWTNRRRAEILNLFSGEVYGRTPVRKIDVKAEILDISKNALGGAATRKQVRLQFPNGHYAEVLIFLPNHVKGPVPVFLGLNFTGNHAVHKDPAIRVTKSWMRAKDNNHQASEKERGNGASRWEVEHVIARGYGTVTAYYGDFDPDFDDGFQNGVHALFPDKDWGSLGAWAWGLSRIMDHLETDKDIDSKRVALHGHSRIGKAALWAGAQDERFAIVISNNSGEGGAALARRVFGETTERINTAFPHWFTSRYKRYNGRESEMPVDQHMLLALIAPRPLYVNSAVEDQWADPRGEFLSALAADPVYRLLGTEGLPAKEMPPIERPSIGRIGYHIRNGKHDVTLYDWTQWMNFADKHWRSPFTGRWNLEAGPNKVYWIGYDTGHFFGATGGRLAEMKDVVSNGNEHRFRVERTFDGGRKVEAFVVARRDGDRLTGSTTVGGRETQWTGSRAPVLAEHDDGTWRKGDPVPLTFPLKSGWVQQDGVLKNTNNKAPTLFTTEHYRNFELHAEYRLQKDGNSGIGLRNHYEVQLEDDFGKAPYAHGNGSVY